MGELGVGTGAQVVLYDARENMWAARVWWMLRAFGFDDAAVLDGGWRAWTSQQRPVCSKPCAYPPAQLTARPRPGLFVGTQEVLGAIGDPDTAIVSARRRRQHWGEINEYGRPGHVPGAKNVSAWAILDKASGRYRPLGELREMCAPVLGAGRVITYCGGGIAASNRAGPRLAHQRDSTQTIPLWAARIEIPSQHLATQIGYGRGRHTDVSPRPHEYAWPSFAGTSSSDPMRAGPPSLLSPVAARSG